jgi:DNA-binding MarR family transcriptional regulator
MPPFKIIHTMNEIVAKTGEELFRYQTARIKDLIEGVVQCCQMQTNFLSRKFEIPQAEIRCLLLFKGERYLTVKGLSQKLDVAKSRVTKVISGLQNKGYVDYADDPRDGRVKLLSLTAKGHKKCEEMGEYIWNNHETLLLELSPEERRSVIASLEVLRVGMEAVKKDLA